MHSVVAGGAGFIGSHLVEELVKRGRRVTVVDDFSNGSRANLVSVASKIKIIERDISNPYTDLFEHDKIDEVYSLACYPRQISLANPRRDCEVNLIGTMNALEVARATGSKVAFASNTGIVSNPKTIPIDETFPPNPLTPYDIHKLASEHLLRVYHKVHRVRSVALRFASVYGPRQRVNETLGWRPVIPEFCTRLLSKTLPTIDGDGSQTRDFIFVKDIVNGVIAAMESKKDDGDMFILGTNNETSILSIYRMISEILRVEAKPKHGPRKPEEIARMRYDYSKARNAFGWSPQVSLSQGLKETVESLEKEYQPSRNIDRS
jgi:UDP-glucose 4-epimerase